MKVQSIKKPSQQHSIKQLFNVSPGHTVSLSQLLRVCPTEYRARISELRKKGLDIQCIDRRAGIYRYYPTEIGGLNV